jgi:hypothetical protein
LRSRSRKRNLGTKKNEKRLESWKPPMNLTEKTIRQEKRN